MKYKESIESIRNYEKNKQQKKKDRIVNFVSLAIIVGATILVFFYILKYYQIEITEYPESINEPFKKYRI